MKSPDFNTLADMFDAPGVAAVVLMGSFARGDSGPFSDVDVVRFVFDGMELDPADGTYLIDDRLIVASSASESQVESWFSEPEQAVVHIAGVRAARALRDRSDYFEAIRRRAQDFKWTALLQEKADRWAGREMVGWIEEVHKGLEGLWRDDVGRLLNARFGLSFGLMRVMATANGVLLSGDNGFFTEVASHVGLESRWASLSKLVFGVDAQAGHPPSLREEVIAGLELYVETARLLSQRFQPDHKPLIVATAVRVDQWLPTLKTRSRSA